MVRQRLLCNVTAGWPPVLQLLTGSSARQPSRDRARGGDDLCPTQGQERRLALLAGALLPQTGEGEEPGAEDVRGILQADSEGEQTYRNKQF